MTCVEGAGDLFEDNKVAVFEGSASSDKSKSADSKVIISLLFVCYDWNQLKLWLFIFTELLMFMSNVVFGCKYAACDLLMTFPEVFSLPISLFICERLEIVFIWSLGLIVSFCSSYSSHQLNIFLSGMR